MRLAVWLPLIIHTLLRNVAGAPTLASVRRINLSLLLQHTHTQVARLLDRPVSGAPEARDSCNFSGAVFLAWITICKPGAPCVIIRASATLPPPPSRFSLTARGAAGAFPCVPGKAAFRANFLHTWIRNDHFISHVRAAAAAPTAVYWRIFLERRAKRDFFAAVPGCSPFFGSAQAAVNYNERGENDSR